MFADILIENTTILLNNNKNYFSLIARIAQRHNLASMLHVKNTSYFVPEHPTYFNDSWLVLC